MRALFFALLVACIAAQNCKQTGCSSGNCCSYWGYCGKGSNYCGSGKTQCACDCNGKNPCKSGSSGVSCINYTTTAALNLRTGPSTNYNIAKTVNKGTTVCVVSITNGWAKLNTGNYCSATYITKSSGGSTTPSTPSTPSCTTKYTTADLNIRAGPGTNYGKVKTVSKGTSLCVVSTSNGWAKLNDGNYCSNQYLTSTKPSSGSSSSGNNSAPTSGSTSSSQLGLSITQKSSPNKGSRGSWKPDVIVCHITEGAYAGAVSWLCNPASSASCHFVVSKKGEISQLVPLTEAAWCQGIKASATPSATAAIVQQRGVNPNLYAVGIEHEGKWSDCKGCLTDAQKMASGKLIKYIALKLKETYGVNFSFDRTHIIGHYEISPRNKPNCPGQNFPWSEVINIAKNA